MAIDFFEKEVKNAQQRFNQTFGLMDVFDLKSRQSTILAICLLARTGDKISKAKKKEDVRAEIKKFMKTRSVLNCVFKRIEKHQKERRGYVNSFNTKRKANRICNIT